MSTGRFAVLLGMIWLFTAGPAVADAAPGVTVCKVPYGELDANGVCQPNETSCKSANLTWDATSDPKLCVDLNATSSSACSNAKLNLEWTGGGKCVVSTTKGQPPVGCYIGVKPSNDYKYDSNTKACVLSSETAAAPSAKDFFANWGVGLGVLRNSPRVVSDASLVNSGGANIVRANSEQQWTTELLLVRHFYMESKNNKDKGGCANKFLFIDSLPTPGVTCFGFMVTVGLGSGNSSSQLIDMVGGGILFGFGGSDTKPDDLPFNVGIGMGRRFGVKMLADGFSVNAPPPPGETQVRYVTKDINAPFLFFTYKMN